MWKSYLRLFVWWAGQRIPMHASFWAAMIATLLFVVAWGAVPFFLRPVLMHDGREFFGQLGVSMAWVSRMCWTASFLCSGLGLLLVARVLVLNWPSYYERYNIPGIRW